jgi:tetratricopeptide (TPR) repeat protein
MVGLPNNEVEAAKKSYAISLNVFKAMEEANLLVEEQQYDQALESLNKQLKKRNSKYEKAQIHSLMGSIHYRKDELLKAIESFKQVLDSSDHMPLSLNIQTLKTLAQLNLVIENYEQARYFSAQIIEKAGDTIKPADYALLAQASYKLEDWEAALEAAMQGRKLSLEMQEIPSENLLLLLNAIRFELNQMDEMSRVLEELIKYYPKTSYMLNLASVYGQLERLDKQTVLMESLYEDGRITSGSQLKNLASLYLSEKAPYKSAVILEKALENGQLETNAANFEMLSQAWRYAAEREKSIVALSQAASLSENGDNYLQQAYLHFDMAQWKETEKALTLGFKKGLSEEHKGEAWLLMGMSHFKMKHYKAAIEACEQAQNYEKSKKHSKSWISYIANEQRKVEAMQSIIN